MNSEIIDSSPSVQNAQSLLGFLSKNKESLSPLLILTHDYPDPDALASAFALSYLAEKVFGIPCRMTYGGVIGRMENRNMVQFLKMPVHKLRPSDLKKYPNVALMDTQPGFENNSFPSDRKATIVIDQHVSVSKTSADLAIIDTECGATCVVLAQALLVMKIEIPARIATALAYGILTDTQNLYRAKRPDIIDTYLRLLPFCDMRALARIQKPSRSQKFFTSLGRAIQNALARGGVVVTHLGNVESPDVVSQIADFFLTYKSAKATMCTGRYKGKLHISLRVESPKISAAEVLRDIVAKKKDAGGHGTIAGGSMSIGLKAPEEVWLQEENKLTECLFKRLHIPLKGEPYYPFRQKQRQTLEEGADVPGKKETPKGGASA